MVSILAPVVSADEGLWLYEAFPAQKVKAAYNFQPNQAFLDHLRLASVRFNDGGSGSFVSAEGLTFTNHHIGTDCLTQISTPERDYIKTGFYAATRADEVKCPNLELDVLQNIEDVTRQVKAASQAGTSTAAQGQAQRAAMTRIEQACARKTGLRCDVTPFFSGGMYHLYTYKKYTDVRLVFAPEVDAAFFGGDPDNFEYPRYDLDICFFRIYENNQPVHLKDYLTFSITGMQEGDLVFVSGNPGSTSRLRTMAELEYMREVRYPRALARLKLWNDALHQFAAQSQESARQAQEDIFDLENSIKAESGEFAGLNDKELMDKKAAEEASLRQFVNANAKLKAETGDPWAALAEAAKVQGEIALPLNYLADLGGFQGSLAGMARDLVRVGAERQKPNEHRLHEYTDAALPSLQQQLFSTAPIYKSLETVWLVTSMTDLAHQMPNDQAVKKLLNGHDPAEVAKTAIANTRLDDVAVRKQLWDGGQKAVDASKDPLIVMMRTIDPEARAVRQRFEDQVDAVRRTQGAKIAQARFQQGGTDVYPDATFTLRLSYGTIKGYVEGNDGPTPPGTRLTAFTTIEGAFDHAKSHDNNPPYQLPDSWMKARSTPAKLDLNTKLNAVNTADIIGGNSGSPVVNKSGEVVGIIFDGNIYSNAWNFMYSDKFGRSIHVDSQGIIEALHDIYGADALVKELLGGRLPKRP
jgi:hypothetical protein